MKTLAISVREDFEIPEIYVSQDIADAPLIELALLTGSQAVRQTILHSTSASLQEHSLKEACSKIEQAAQRELTLQNQLKEIRQQHEAELVNLQSRIHSERMRIREEVLASMESEIDRAKREATLTVKEKHAAEREVLIKQLEERHALSVARSESHNAAQLAETRRTLDSLRAEHEGLVVKLLSRLEIPSSAGLVEGRGRTSTSAAALGRSFEESVERHLRSVFGARDGFRLDDVHATGHCGDLIMIFDDLRILIELKSYDPRTRVPTKEVEKLARDLAESEPRCDAGIMISACSEISGHYSCGPLEVSANAACVPILFINNFLSLGEPQLTLHMTRVFISMVHVNSQTTRRIAHEDATSALPESERILRLERTSAECARRCTGYLAELNRQSTDLLRQALSMKTSAMKLRESVIALVECEVARLTGIIQLMSDVPQLPAPITADAEAAQIFIDPTREFCSRIREVFSVGDLTQKCPTKDILAFIQADLKLSTEKAAREAMKTIFHESVLKHGFVVGVMKNN